MCLNYLATFPDVTITQTKFYVMLCTDSDIAHLVEKNEKSRAGGQYFFSEFLKDVDKGEAKVNGVIHILVKHSTI